MAKEIILFDSDEVVLGEVSSVDLTQSSSSANINVVVIMAGITVMAVLLPTIFKSLTKRDIDLMEASGRTGVEAQIEREINLGSLSGWGVEFDAPTIKEKIRFIPSTKNKEINDGVGD